MKDPKAFLGSSGWYPGVRLRAVIARVLGRASEIELYPLQLGFHDSAIRWGVPRLAASASGSRILARLARLSISFGTTIKTRDGAGVINLQ